MIICHKVSCNLIIAWGNDRHPSKGSRFRVWDAITLPFQYEIICCAKLEGVLSWKITHTLLESCKLNRSSYTSAQFESWALGFGKCCILILWRKSLGMVSHAPSQIWCTVHLRSTVGKGPGTCCHSGIVVNWILTSHCGQYTNSCFVYEQSGKYSSLVFTRKARNVRLEVWVLDI